MKERKLVICDSNEKYLQAMQEYLVKRRIGSFQIACFTEFDAMLQSSKREPFAILLLSEALYQEKLSQVEADKIYILEEGLEQEIGDYPYLAKYQSMEKLIKTLLENYIVQSQVAPKTYGKRARILSFYSPQQFLQQSAYALAAGQELALTRKVLYLNLHAFAGFETLQHTQYETDITDFIYFIRKHPDKTAYKLESMKRTIGELDYIAPAADFQDLLSISEDEWSKILDILETQTEYDDIVLDVSPCCIGLYEILERSASIYMPRSNAVIAEAAREQFETLLRRKERQHMLEKIRYVPMATQLQEGEYSYDRLRQTAIGETMRTILQEDGYVASGR